jgi:hypothetical protein
MTKTAAYDLAEKSQNRDVHKVSVPCDIVVNAKGDVMLVVSAEPKEDATQILVNVPHGDLQLEFGHNRFQLGSVPKDLLEKVQKTFQAILAFVWNGQIMSARKIPVVCG